MHRGLNVTLFAVRPGPGRDGRRGIEARVRGCRGPDPLRPTPPLFGLQI